MRIAILFAGYFRCFEETFPNFKENILAPLKEHAEVDIFAHTWHNVPPEHFTATHFGYIPPKLEEIDISRFCELYQPKQIVNEDFLKIKPSLKLKNFVNINDVIDKIWNWKIWWDGVTHTTCFFYKVNKVNELKKQEEIKNNFKYDFVIKYRTELFAPCKIDITKFSKDNIYASDFGHESKMIDDQIWLGSSEMLDYMCDIFNNLTEIFPKANDPTWDHGFVAEKMMYHYLREKYEKTGKWQLAKLAENGVMGKKFSKAGRLGIN